MEQTKKDFEKLDTIDLLDEVISLAKGDGWDGMSSKKNNREYDAAIEVLKEKISASRIEKLEIALTNLIAAIPSQNPDKDWWGDDLTDAVNAANAVL